MALNWRWDEKVGEATFKEATVNGKEGREYICDLYQGNALLIIVYRYKTEEDEKENTFHYELMGFFADKEHGKRNLGLAKGYAENNYDGWMRGITLYRNRLGKQDYKDLTTLFTQATFCEGFTLKVENAPEKEGGDK